MQYSSLPVYNSTYCRVVFYLVCCVCLIFISGGHVWRYFWTRLLLCIPDVKQLQFAEQRTTFSAISSRCRVPSETADQQQRAQQGRTMASADTGVEEGTLLGMTLPEALEKWVARHPDKVQKRREGGREGQRDRETHSGNVDICM